MERHPCSWIRRSNIAKMVIFPKLIYGFNTVSIKIPAAFFLQKLTIHMQIQGTQNSQNNLEK